MPRADQSLYAFNRGVVSPLGLARSDVKRLSLAAETQTNMIPRVLGSMSLRPGTKYVGGIASNAAARMLRFIFATDDTALLEMTNLVMRIWMNDALLTRPAVTTAIVNGTFAGSLAGWTDLDEAGAASVWLAGDLMQLVGTGTAFAIEEQQVTVAGGNIGVEHGLRIVIFRGPVVVRIGSTSGDDNYLSETELGTGTHSISITPAGNFFLRFQSRLTRPVYVQSVAIEAAGAVSLPTPYGSSVLGKLRTDQSGDVVYIACDGKQQRKIERRGTRPNARSWSIVLYQPPDGPFRTLNVSPTTLTPGALTGTISLTASAKLFKSTHVGALFSITSVGQFVTATAAASALATTSIRVTGIGDERTFVVVITGDATASTVDLQRSYDNATWSNVGAPEQWTANVTTTFKDGLDNQIVFYRLILTTRVAPDSVTMQLRIGSGSIRGVVRVTDYVSPTVVTADVLTDMGGTTASADWEEGLWSDLRGWPTSVRLHEGRLWWFGQNGILGSISDAFDSFDETLEGNAGPINRSIGSGPVDAINWGLSLKGLMLGADGAEYSVRASSLDEAITPTNFNVKAPSTQGSGRVEAVKADLAGYFVDRSGTNVYELAFDLKSYDFQSSNLMELVPGLGSPGIVRMDVQRKPDTRLHCVRSDGTVVMAMMNKGEDALAWIPITTDGLIEDVVVLPALVGNKDDQVYYVVARVVSGGTVRYLEKWAQESECQGGTLNLQADAYVTYSGAPATVITGLAHLEGKSVVVWADGVDVGTNDTVRPWTQTYTVAGGQITLAVAASNVVVGLGYTGQFKSAKLGLAVQGGTFLNQNKRVDRLGLVLAATHPRGLKFGPTLDDVGSLAMDDMPGVEESVAVSQTTVPASYDHNMIEFPGNWTSDTRLCLQAQAPRPATIVAVTFELSQH
jgi:hypothetical protein